MLEYTGPKKLEEMWADGNFTDIRPVQVQRNSVMRCRPILTLVCNVCCKLFT
jgi:hypothetical protein